MAQAVNGRSVDPVDAGVQRLVNGRDRILIVLCSPSRIPSRAADRPRSEADRRDVQVRVPSRFVFMMGVSLK